MRSKVMVGALAALTMVAGLAPPSGAASGTGQPTLSLRRTSAETTAYKFGTRKPRVRPPVFVQAEDAPLDLRVRRASYEDLLAVSQVLHAPQGTETVELPADVLTGWRGLADFIEVEVRNSDGKPVYSYLLASSPNGMKSSSPQ